VFMTIKEIYRRISNVHLSINVQLFLHCITYLGFITLPSFLIWMKILSPNNKQGNRLHSLLEDMFSGCGIRH
jgi:hypothetical protein